MHWLGRDLVFPDPEQSSEEGLVAIGGDCSPERLVLAYGQGIFPWPVGGMPLLWFCPDPRFVLYLDEVHLARSLRRRIRRGTYRITFDRAFDRVVLACASTHRPGQAGTWITEELREGYGKLHERGLAHSAEAWDADGRLVGGLYGVSLGRVFYGESMFARSPDASKVAFAMLLAQLRVWRFAFVDCQAHTEHLARFGARFVPRHRFLRELREALTHPSRSGIWHLDLGPDEALEQLRPSNETR